MRIGSRTASTREKSGTARSRKSTRPMSRTGLDWSFDIRAAPAPPGGGNQEATLIASNGVLYRITTWSIVYAVDARTGKQLWKWDPEVNRPAVQLKICCGIVNRGVAIYEGKIIAPIIDGRLVALDAETGKPVWESRVAYPQNSTRSRWRRESRKARSSSASAAGSFPCADSLMRSTRAPASSPGASTRCLAIPRSRSRTKRCARPPRRGAGLAQDGRRRHGLGRHVLRSAADLLYFGTGNGGPWPRMRGPRERKGQPLCCSILAVSPETGKLVWYFQMVPGDEWDYDSVQQLMLADVTIKGQQRKVIMQANKNGYYYVIDRITGEFISGQPFARVTWASGLNEETGRPIINPESYYGAQAVPISPSNGGAHNWAPMSFNPALVWCTCPRPSAGPGRILTIRISYIRKAR